MHHSVCRTRWRQRNVKMLDLPHHLAAKLLQMYQRVWHRGTASVEKSAKVKTMGVEGKRSTSPMGFNCAVDSGSTGSHPETNDLLNGVWCFATALHLSPATSCGVLRMGYISSASGLFGEWLTSGVVSVASVGQVIFTVLPSTSWSSLGLQTWACLPQSSHLQYIHRSIYCLVVWSDSALTLRWSCPEQLNFNDCFPGLYLQ